MPYSVLLNRAPSGCFDPIGDAGGWQSRGVKAESAQRLGTGRSCRLNISAFDRLHRQVPSPLPSISEFRTPHHVPALTTGHIEKKVPSG